MGALDCVTNHGLSGGDSTEVFAVSTSTHSLGAANPSGDQEKARMLPRFFWWRVTLDVPIAAIVVLLVGLFELGVLPCHKAGFFCRDPTLSYVYNGDTVSTAVLISTVICMAPVVIFITELLIHEDDFERCRSRAVSALRTTLSLFRIYLFGLVINLLIVEALKGVLGNPRPTFFDLCRPKEAATCTENEYVTSFECTPTLGLSKWKQMDSYRSFPSGHTSLSVYAGLFIVWYLQQRAFSWANKTMLTVPAIQLLCVTYAAICSMTRITDHRHHWWDVLTGFAIGVVTLSYTVLVLLNNFRGPKKGRQLDASQNSVNKLVDQKPTLVRV